MPLPFERKIAVIFILAVATLAFIGGAAWWSLARFERGFDRVDDAHQVLAGLEEILVDALSVQTGSRGYALSSDPAFLVPFESGLRRVHASIADVRRRTADEAHHVAALGELVPHIERLVALMERRNAAISAGDTAAAEDREVLESGRQAMAEIRRLIASMAQAERSELSAHTRELQSDAARTRAILLLAVAASLVVVAAAGTRVQRDLVARRRADEALARSRAVFETLFEQATDALVVVGPEGAIRRVNRRTEDLFGCPRSALIGRPVEHLMPARFRAAHTGHRAAFEAGPQFRAMGAGLELFALRHDGTEFPVDIMLSPLDTDEGRVVLAAIRDVTERKAAAAALQRSADEIRDLYNLAPCGYHSLDENGVFVAINDTELQWLGYSREEVIGRMHFADLLTAASRERFHEEFPRFKRTGRVEGLEFEMRRSDGRTFFVSLSATATRDEAGHYVASRSTVHDITARREAEAHLARLHAELQRHSEKLEEANEHLESFTSSVSHDLRAPLRHLSGFAAILADHATDKLDDEGRHCLAVIDRSARKMSRLIDDLLAFSRTSRARLNRALVDTDRQVRSLVADPPFDRTPTTIWRIEPLPTVKADRALLEQVWVNLLGNAAKYSARASSPVIDVSATRDDALGETIFCVRDNGVGFDSSQADKLFNVFARLHTEAEFSGTGIGLALVKRIIARHGGRVWAEGSPGAGAAFYFTLPDSETQAQRT